MDTTYLVKINSQLSCIHNTNVAWHAQHLQTYFYAQNQCKCRYLSIFVASSQRLRLFTLQTKKLKQGQLSYPHFGPKNTRLNSLSIPKNFFNLLCITLQFTTVLQLHTLLFLSYNFCIKTYKRVFWSFPAMEPIFRSRHLFLSLFQLVCAIYLFNFVQKSFVSASESACVSLSRFVPRGILVISHCSNFGQRGILKYLILVVGSFQSILSVLTVSLYVVFKLLLFTSFIFIFLQFSLNFCFNCILVQVFVVITFQPQFQFFRQTISFTPFFKQSKLFKIAKQSQFLHNCKTVQIFYTIADQSSRATRAVQSRWQVPIGSESTWQPI